MIAPSTSVEIKSVNLHRRPGINPSGRKQRFFAICEVASVFPVRSHPDIDQSWTVGKDRRRCALIDRGLHEELTVAEQRELSDLQRQAEANFDEVAPPPIDSALKLHAQLMKLASGQNE